MRLTLPQLIPRLLGLAALLSLCGCNKSADLHPASFDLDTSESQQIPNAADSETAIAANNDQIAGLGLNEEQRRSVERIQKSKAYPDDLLDLATADVELQVYNDDSDEIVLQIWKKRWERKLESFSLTGGCGCCVDIYTVTGPKAAIEEFPISEYRRKYYPQYRELNKDGG